LNLRTWWFHSSWWWWILIACVNRSLNLNLTWHHFTGPHSKDWYTWGFFIIYKVSLTCSRWEPLNPSNFTSIVVSTQPVVLLKTQ
jgi:hypothetical protein